MLKKLQTKKYQLARLAIYLTATPEINQNPKTSRTPILARPNTHHDHTPLPFANSHKPPITMPTIAHLHLTTTDPRSLNPQKISE